MKSKKYKLWSWKDPELIRILFFCSKLGIRIERIAHWFYLKTGKGRKIWMFTLKKYIFAM